VPDHDILVFDVAIFGNVFRQAVAAGMAIAGLGIAFRAKPKLQAVASMSLNHNERLDTLLYLMGWNERDLRTV